MTIYVDTSALARVYLGDQSEGEELAQLIFKGSDPVVTCELTDVEIASAFARAAREGVIDSSTAGQLLSQYTADTADDGPLGVIPMASETIALAQQFVLNERLRPLDALHLAACAQFREATTDEVRLLSRDVRQNAAAKALGMGLVNP